MKYNKIILLIIVVICNAVFSSNTAAQHNNPTNPNNPNKDDSAWENHYQGSPEMTHNLVHTKLEVSFDFEKSQLNGKAWISLKPHFYSSDSVRLDAKGMAIHQLGLWKDGKLKELVYNYDGLNITIQLDKSYTNKEQFELFIDYTAKPNELGATGSAAITDAKGLYFINPDGTIPGKPTQIWTQGETEATSVWCPTIDKPNQKTTQEIAMKVPERFVTLSNGKLVSQKKNKDGTRTDTWKMDLPHAPYLFFMGVGEYAVVKDSYKGKEVSYYVEKEYAPFARMIFGDTPKMMEFFSQMIGVEYPWVKYAQITGRDYVSGAMENTTATLHQESAQQNGRELVDGNHWEATIAHELFHHWFGDLVTAESWSNLTVNESFANYSEYLWLEHKYGRDKADEHNYTDLQGYLLGEAKQKDLVRFYYRDKEDMFDVVSYNKGGRILHMLRNYVGDSAFYKTLNRYISGNMYKSAEAHQVRLALEEVTGRDMNPFFNQWYFGAGHPVLDIHYRFDAEKKSATVFVQQIQQSKKLFTLPIAIDVYENGVAKRRMVTLRNRLDTFQFPYTTRPDFINVDAEKILIAEKNDNKSAAEFKAQFVYAKNYMDRREAVEYFTKNSVSTAAQDVLKLAFKDRFEGIRRITLELLLERQVRMTPYLPDIEHLAKNDPVPLVKAAALNILNKQNSVAYAPIFHAALNDSSYSVVAAALDGLYLLQTETAITEAKKQSVDARGKLAAVIARILIKHGTATDFDFVAKAYGSMPLNQDKLDFTLRFCDFLGSVNDTKQFKEGLNHVIAFRNSIPSSIYFVQNLLNDYMKTIIVKKQRQIASGNVADLEEQINYIKQHTGKF